MVHESQANCAFDDVRTRVLARVLQREERLLTAVFQFRFHTRIARTGNFLAARRAKAGPRTRAAKFEVDSGSLRARLDLLVLFLGAFGELGRFVGIARAGLRRYQAGGIARLEALAACEGLLRRRELLLLLQGVRFLLRFQLFAFPLLGEARVALLEPAPSIILPFLDLRALLPHRQRHDSALFWIGCRSSSTVTLRERPDTQGGTAMVG